jgi:hypothetical protein
MSAQRIRGGALRRCAGEAMPAFMVHERAASGLSEAVDSGPPIAQSVAGTGVPPIPDNRVIGLV